MLSRIAFVLMVAGATTATAKPKVAETLTGKGPLNAENALALAQQAIGKGEEGAAREIKVVGDLEGKLVGLADNKISTVGPVMVLLVNVIDKKSGGELHWAPRLFVMKARGTEIELASQLEPPDLTHDFDPAEDKGSKLALATLALTKEANAIMVTLRKAEGNGAGGNIEETTVIYLVQRDSFAIAFSTRTEVTSSEKLDGVMETKKEVNKIELGKKGNRLADLMVTTHKYEIKGDNTDEYKPSTERWCWNDKATSYLPECK